MRLTAGTIKDPFKALLLLRRTYKNWSEIISHYFSRRPLRRIVLRDGLTIPIERETSSLMASFRHYHRWYDPSIYNLIGLARLLGRGWRIKGVEGDFLLLAADPSTVLKCRLKQGTDISLLGEIFVRQVYGSDFQGKTVVDVGAYMGDSAIFFTRHGAKLVIALEPDPTNLRLAEENVKLNQLTDRILLVNAALSAESGESRLGHNEAIPNISQVIDRSSSRWESVEVETITVEDVMKRFGLGRIDVLKLNCEGCEYGIIRNLQSETLK